MKRALRTSIAVGRRARRARPAASRIGTTAASKDAARPTRDQVLRRIRKLYHRDESLRREDVTRQDPTLERAARNYFGTWRHAVEAAGIPVRGYEQWDKERVLGEIRERHRRGDALAHTRAPSQLVNAGITHFGTWRIAVESAGLDYESVRLRAKTPEEVIALIQDGARTGRRGVGPEGFITVQVAAVARSHFGTLRAAIVAAGLVVKDLLRVRTEHDEITPKRKRGRPPRSDDSVAAELQRLAHDQPNMSLTEFGKNGAGKLLIKRYGTLRAGLAAFGISGWPRQVKLALPSPEETVAAIHARHQRGELMAVGYAMVTDRRLVKAAYKWFGTWRGAMRAAGLGAQVDDKLWDRAQVRAELNGRRLRGEANEDDAIQHDDPRLWSEIIERYGDLAAALRDAARARRKSARNAARWR
jgi:hypothetical protein